MVLEDLLPARVYQHVSIIRTHKEKLDPQFLMYYMISPLMQSRMLSFAGSGGTRKALTKEMIENFDIPLIDHPTQQKIASIPSAYDDLIDINCRRIQLLEEAARLLFREWFVYFRFPGHEKIKIVDGLPEGWKRVHLEDLVETQYGYTETATDEELGPKFLRGTDINKNSYIDWCAVPYCTEQGLNFEKYALSPTFAIRGVDNPLSQ